MNGIRIAKLKISDINKETLSVIVFTIIHVSIIVFMYLGGFLKYEVKDDFVMSAIAAGTFGINSPYLVYINIVLGKIISTLFNIFPWVNWLTCMYLAMSVLSMSMLCHVMIQKYKLLCGQIISYSTLFLLIPITYLGMNYTKFTGVFTLIGFILIQYVFERDRINKFILVIGVLLVFLGSMLRFNAFLLVLPFSILSAMKAIFDREISKNRLYRYLITLIAVFLVVMLTVMVDRLAYTYDEQWEEYQYFNNARTELFDYSIPSYEENIDEYQMIGISENDLDMIRSGRMSDSQIFSIENLNNIISIRDNSDSQFRTINKEFIKQLFSDIFTKYLKNSVVIIAFILSASFLFSKKRLIFVFSAWMLCCGELAYLEYMGRPIDRVTILPIVGVLFFFLNNIPKDIRRNNNCISINYIYMFVLSIGLLFALFIEQKPISRTVEAEALVEDIKSEEGLYVCSASDIYRGYSIFDLPMKDGLVNMVFESGWLTQSPYVDHVLMEHLGTDNLYGSILNNPKLFFVQYADDTRLAFFREHYSDKIGCSLVDNKCGYNIYTYAASLNNVLLSELEWEVDFESEKCFYDENFYQIRIVLEEEIDAEDIYLEICDLENTDAGYIYKAFYSEEGIMCNFDSADWVDAEQAECHLLYVNKEGNIKSKKTVYITFSH